MALNYTHLLLIFAAALLFIVLQVWLRKPWHSRSAGIQNLLNKQNAAEADLNHHYLVPLLAYEEEYPSFGNIVGLVLQKFPLSRFLGEDDFRQALEYLRSSVFETSDRGNLVAAMGVIVNTFVRDPDVEYHCRPHLKALVVQFLEEIERPDEHFTSNY